jgi:hypothetical protein
MSRKYYKERMQAAVKRLPASEDLLIATLCEIIEDLVEAEAVEAVS